MLILIFFLKRDDKDFEGDEMKILIKELLVFISNKVVVDDRRRSRNRAMIVYGECTLL